MEKDKLKKISNIILIIFLIIQPIFDIKIFYNSISTLIRVIIIGILFIINFGKDRNNKKYYLIIYPILVLIYFIFHHINAQNFKSLVPDNFNYSILKEALYFVKMLTPFLLIYTIYKSNIEKEQIIRTIKIITIIISLVIIITNIFGISYGSYSDVKITANFLAWFNGNYSYRDLASKGFFEYANQIGAILIMFLPIIMLHTIKNNKKNKINITILSMAVFALLLLGTKVAVLGILISFIYTIFVIIFVDIIKKDKINIKNLKSLSIVILIYLLLLPFNPIFNRIDERKKVIATFAENTKQVVTTDMGKNNEETLIPIENKSKEDKKNQNHTYIETHYKEKLIPDQFILTNYPYQYDLDFWMDILESDINLRTNFRFIEQAMIKRVIQINNNPYDKWLGITNTRLQNVFNIEKDFVVQYYALGIIGLFLIFIPYISILLKVIYDILKSKFSNMSYMQLILLIDVILVFCIAYFSGNLLNSLSFTTYFACILALLLIECKKLA